MYIFQQLFFVCITYSLFANFFVEGKRPLGQGVCRFEDQNFQTEFFLNVLKENKLENLKEEYDKYKKQSALYTGFVIEKQYEYQIFPFQISNFLRVTFCKEGKPVWYDSFPFQNDLDWSQPICVPSVEEDATSKNHSICFKFARVQKYTQRNVTLYFPNKFVGFVFFCNSSGTSPHSSENYGTVPLTPIISDNIRDYKTSWRIKGAVTKVIPYLHTLSIPMSRYEMLTDPDVHNPEQLEYKSLTSEFLGSYKSLEKLRNKGMSWLNRIDPMEKYDKIKSENVWDFHEHLDKTINKIGRNIEKPRSALIRTINARSRQSNDGSMARRKYLKKKVSRMLRSKIPLQN
ncbi:hypothetical protein N7582_002045 [Saccharomyces uvarum]|uniref:YGL138C-like protein n=1 Tax=Saccharomyces uvarum TaxID=230603 RepID=A0AA35JHB0_SACUV|nr:hypothetical protein N7582_002045 [Saccharomyces uvarum]CAI4062095.1 hypothetical protein SUVC_07G1130 [Saccharomyces uvarum]